jgi:hypothetical protein
LQLSWAKYSAGHGGVLSVDLFRLSLSLSGASRRDRHALSHSKLLAINVSTLQRLPRVSSNDGASTPKISSALLDDLLSNPAHAVQV